MADNQPLETIRALFAELHKQHPNYRLWDVDKFIDAVGAVLGFDMSVKPEDRRDPEEAEDD